MQKRNTTITFGSIGDCAIDKYIPDAKKYLGGTAFNSALIAAKIGAASSLFSAVGDDNAGKVYISTCHNKSIDTKYLQVLPELTSTIVVNTSDKENPQYLQWELHALKNYLLNTEAKNALATMHIAKIALFTPLQNLFDQFIGLSLPQTVKVVDFSGISSYTDGLSAIQKYAQGCDVIVKSTDDEDVQSIALLREISKMKGKISLLLLGDKGSMVFQDGLTLRQPIVPTQVIDTNGAGDAYIAAFCYFYAKRTSISYAMEQAATIASAVVARAGGSSIAFSE